MARTFAQQLEYLVKATGKDSEEGMEAAFEQGQTQAIGQWLLLLLRCVR